MLLGLAGWLGLVLGSASLAAADAPSGADPAPRPVWDLELPDLDLPVPGILDLDAGELRPVPRPGSFENVEAYKAALASIGDLAYEDAQGGMLFVASGAVLPLGSTAPKPTALRKLAERLEARSFLRGSELEPGAWFAARTREGKLVLARVVTRSRHGLRLRGSPPGDPKIAFREGSIRAIAARQERQP